MGKYRVLDLGNGLPRTGRERAVEVLRTPPRGQDADLPRLVRGETEGRTVRERDLAREAALAPARHAQHPRDVPRHGGFLGDDQFP